MTRNFSWANINYIDLNEDGIQSLADLYPSALWTKTIVVGLSLKLNKKTVGITQLSRHYASPVQCPHR